MKSLLMLCSLLFALNALAAPVIIDVRSPEEFAQKHLSGAINLPHDHITETIGTAVKDKNADIVLYCRSGRRSGLAQEALQKLGYTRVKNLGAMEAAEKTLQCQGKAC